MCVGACLCVFVCVIPAGFSLTSIFDNYLASSTLAAAGDECTDRPPEDMDMARGSAWSMMLASCASASSEGTSAEGILVLVRERRLAAAGDTAPRRIACRPLACDERRCSPLLFSAAHSPMGHASATGSTTSLPSDQLRKTRGQPTAESVAASVSMDPTAT